MGTNGLAEYGLHSLESVLNWDGSTHDGSRSLFSFPKEAGPGRMCFIDQPPVFCPNERGSAPLEVFRFSATPFNIRSTGKCVFRGHQSDGQYIVARGYLVDPALPRRKSRATYEELTE
jgi:hypothetical protein